MNWRGRDLLWYLAFIVASGVGAWADAPFVAVVFAGLGVLQLMEMVLHAIADAAGETIRRGRE